MRIRSSRVRRVSVSVVMSFPKHLGATLIFDVCWFWGGVVTCPMRRGGVCSSGGVVEVTGDGNCSVVVQNYIPTRTVSGRVAFM